MLLKYAREPMYEAISQIGSGSRQIRDAEQTIRAVQQVLLQTGCFDETINRLEKEKTRLTETEVRIRRLTDTLETVVHLYETAENKNADDMQSYHFTVRPIPSAFVLLKSQNCSDIIIE